MLGVFVLRIAGLATALRARESLNRGELPAQTMLEGLMLALAGGLLILPGFISDVLGLIMLLPSPVVCWPIKCASAPKSKRSASVRSPMTFSPVAVLHLANRWGGSPM
jgi:UPF0716 family protein affecting phage T7 exclusion